MGRATTVCVDRNRCSAALSWPRPKKDHHRHRHAGDDVDDVVVSPDELNAYLRTFIVAPLTTGGHPYPFRIPCRFGRRSRHVVLDQIRTVDRERLGRRLGRLAPSTLGRALTVLREMFML